MTKQIDFDLLVSKCMETCRAMASASLDSNKGIKATRDHAKALVALCDFHASELSRVRHEALEEAATACLMRLNTGRGQIIERETMACAADICALKDKK